MAGLFFCAFALFAFGIKEKNNSPEEQPLGIVRPFEACNEAKALPAASLVQITGIVRLVGNSPFTELVVTTSKGEWYITKEEKEKLLNMQHQTVTVEGEETVRELRFASGRSAGKRRNLRNIKIISIE